jgi:two-component system, OmpR family, response regulator BaeR
LETPVPAAAAADARLVLVVEDEPSLATLLHEALAAEGFRVEVLHEGGGVVAWIRERRPDAVLLDLLLPGKDGFSICREVRAFSTVPMIMITARAEQIDRLLGLELGADDYICKPFHPREVVARLRALLRRTLDWGAPTGTPGAGLALDEEGFSAAWDGQPLGLTPVEFRLLKALAQRPGRVLSRDQLLDAIYVDHRVVSDRTVDSHVKNLRRKLADAGADPIQAVYGVGYKFQVG